MIMITTSKYRLLKPHILPILALLATTCAIYARSLGHDFLDNWDDQLYVVTNPAIRGLNWPNIKAAFSSYYVGNYAPLQIISYMLDFELWGLESAGFIFTNITLHVLNGVLFYALLFRTIRSRSVALLAALFFVVHPVQVESVAWVSQRKNLLSMFFFLWSFHIYLSSRARSNIGTTILYVASIATFILALLAKPVAVILPLALLAYDFSFSSDVDWRKAIKNKLPYLASALIMIVVSMYSQETEIVGGLAGYHGGSRLTTGLTMLTAFVQYLIILFFPFHLSAIYPLPLRTTLDGQVVLAILVLTLCIALGIKLCQRRSQNLFWFLLFFIGLFPASNIIPLATLMNDRYLYFPMLGFAAMFGIIASPLQVAETVRKYVSLRLGAASLVIIIFSILSYFRCQVWQNSIILWTDAVIKGEGGSGYDNNVNFASNALANSYVLEGNRREVLGDSHAARIMFLEALSYDPCHYDALGLLGSLSLDEDKPLLARHYLLRLTEVYKLSARGYYLLGKSYLATGERERAETALRLALKVEPDNEEIKEELARTLRTWNR